MIADLLSVKATLQQKLGEAGRNAGQIRFSADRMVEAPCDLYGQIALGRSSLHLGSHDPNVV